MQQEHQKLRGALLVFTILQVIYLFSFMIQFPNSFRNALGDHYNVLDGVASWLSTLTMLGYCITCLVAVTQLVMHKHAFLQCFQISGAIAMVGNFIVFILREIADVSPGYYFYSDDTYYWGLLVMALFWTVSWGIYFAQSSRLYSYMGNDAAYLQTAFFTKKVKTPAPWKEPAPPYPYGQPQVPVPPQGPLAPPQQRPPQGYAPSPPPPSGGMPPYRPYQQAPVAPPPAYTAVPEQGPGAPEEHRPQ